MLEFNGVLGVKAMKNLLLIAITILAVGCGGKDESTTETKPVEEKVLEVKEEVKPELEGVNEDELEERKGIVYLNGSDTSYTGKIFRLDKNGKKEFETNFKQGKQDGLGITWYKDGQKERETNFKDGKLDGPMNAWHENGHKKFETHFKDGIIEGLWTEWHKNGHKSLEDNYKDGKPDGLSVQWHENGQKMAEGNYKDGKPDGLLRGWHDNGQKKGELTYKDRKMISEKYWNSKGEQVDSLDEAKVE